MRNPIALIVVATLLLVGSHSAATPFTTTDLVNECRSVRQGVSSHSASWCLGYVFGFASALAAFTNLVCPPPPVKGGQLVEVFLNWADKHPKMWHVPPVLAVGRALRAAFPCRKPK